MQQLPTTWPGFQGGRCHTALMGRLLTACGCPGARIKGLPWGPRSVPAVDSDSPMEGPNLLLPDSFLYLKDLAGGLSESMLRGAGEGR